MRLAWRLIFSFGLSFWQLGFKLLKPIFFGRFLLLDKRIWSLFDLINLGLLILNLSFKLFYSRLDSDSMFFKFLLTHILLINLGFFNIDRFSFWFIINVDDAFGCYWWRFICGYLFCFVLRRFCIIGLVQNLLKICEVGSCLVHDSYCWVVIFCVHWSLSKVIVCRFFYLI